MLEDAINKDLKSALLAGDKTLATTLRGLKSSILYAKIAANSRDAVMPDDQIIIILQKEAKKRQESADLYHQGGSEQRANAELAEKKVVEQYLPKQLTEAEIAALVSQAVNELGARGLAAMGAVIGRVKQEAGGAADGAVIARIVKERLTAAT